MKERVVTITGERGCLVASTLVNELWFHRNGSVTTASPADPRFHGASEGDSIRYAVAKREALVVELETFRDAVLQKTADIVTLDQGVDTLEVAYAVLAASKECTAITVDTDKINLSRWPDAGYSGDSWRTS